MKIFAKIVLMALLPTCFCAMQQEKTIDYGKKLIDAASLEPRANWELVEECIKKTDDIDQTNRYGETALIFAAKANQRDIIRLLAKKGAHVNHYDSFEHTALLSKILQDTITEEDKKTMKLLVKELHAHTNLENGLGETPLMLAMYKKNKGDLISWMIDELGFDVNYPNKRGYTMLMHAIKNNASLSMIKTLVQRGAQVNAEDEQGRTALSIAGHYDNEDAIIPYLKAHGTTDGMTDHIRRCAKYNWYVSRPHHGIQLGVLTALLFLAEVTAVYGISVDMWSLRVPFLMAFVANPLILILWMYSCGPTLDPY